jgi:hypothetical protein
MKSFTLIESALNGFRRTERAVDNALARKNYRKFKAAPSSQTPSVEKKKTKQSQYLSKRTLSPPLEESKFNLRTVASGDTELKTHPLYEPMAKLLRILYQNNLFDQTPKLDHVEYLLLEAILNKLHKSEGDVHFAEICPDDPKLKTLYYRMLKGTNRYTQGNGVPPFADYFSLEKTSQPVNLCFASPPLLEALFGAEISGEILKEERKKWEVSNSYYFISKNDLQTLLSKNPANASLLPLLEPWLSDSKKFKARTWIAGRDQITGIGIEKRCQ